MNTNNLNGVTNPAPGGETSGVILFNATTVSEAPELPDTGFSPVVSGSVFNGILLVLGIIVGLTLMVLERKRALSAK